MSSVDLYKSWTLISSSVDTWCDSTVKANVNTEGVVFSSLDRFIVSFWEGREVAGSPPRSTRISIGTFQMRMMMVQSVGRGSSFLFRLRRMMAAEGLAILRLEGQEGVTKVIDSQGAEDSSRFWRTSDMGPSERKRMYGIPMAIWDRHRLQRSLKFREQTRIQSTVSQSCQSSQSFFMSSQGNMIEPRPMPSAIIMEIPVSSPEAPHPDKGRPQFILLSRDSPDRCPTPCRRNYLLTSSHHPLSLMELL